MALSVCGAALKLTSSGRGEVEQAISPRVLLIRPDHLGDVLMSSPSVEVLRKALPHAHLAMMVGPWSAEVARRDPLLDEVLVCPFPGFTRAPKGTALGPYLLLSQTARWLRRQRYDAALVLRFDHWWGAWMAALAGIPIRVGCAVGECAPFLTHSVEPLGRVHWVEQSLRVAGRFLEACGIVAAGHSLRPALRFAPKEEDEREASLLWSTLDLHPHRPVVAFHPGTGSALKLWPEERWIALGWSLAGKGVQVVVTGSQAEASRAERVVGAIPNGRSLAGRTTVGTLAALLRRCDLVVGVDNGPLHFAVALGVRTVHLFGPTDPAVYGPWGDPARHRVVAAEFARPCGQLEPEPQPGVAAPCMEGISSERVAWECERLLTGAER